MKVRHFFAVCLAGMVWSGIGNPGLLACEQCDSRHACSACCQRDDRGLLDRIDSALTRRQPSLQRVCLPQLPSLRGAFQSGLRGGCGCGGAASCGCEISQATCGCEIAPASCGTELSVLDGHSGEQLQWNSSIPAYAEVPLPQVAPDDFSPRQKPVQHAPRDPQVVPLPQRVPAETLPTPDSENDPFRDDSARVLRRVPVQSIQLRPSGSVYRQSYDPQARQESSRATLEGQASPTQQRRPTSLSQFPSSHLDAQGSSRHESSAPAIEPRVEQPLPAVVTASGLASSNYEQQPSRTSSRVIRSNSDSRSSDLRSSESVQRQPAAGFNPLRSSRSQQ